MTQHPVRDASAELFWTFFPVLIVVFVLFLLGRTDTLLRRTDLILVAAVLFAEGWARSKKIYRHDRRAYAAWGFFGSIVTIAVAVLMLLNEVDGGSLAKVVDSWRFALLHYAMLFLSVFYGWLVRIKVNVNIFAGHSGY